MGTKDKLVGAVQSKNLAWDANYEKAIDRITAMGMSDPIGTALWRFKYCNDASSHRRAVALLIEKSAPRAHIALRDPFQHIYLTRIVIGAVREWTLDQCNHCLGSKRIIQKNGVIIDCPKCQGTGLRNYTDSERAKNCGLKTWEAGNQKHFQAVMECLTGSAARVGGQIRDLLADENNACNILSK